MSRADRLKAEAVKEKDRHDVEVKQLAQTLKVASGPSDAEDPSSQFRDGGLGDMYAGDSPNSG